MAHPVYFSVNNSFLWFLLWSLLFSHRSLSSHPVSSTLSVTLTLCVSSQMHTSENYLTFFIIIQNILFMCKTMDNMFVLEHNSNALCVTKILPSSEESIHEWWTKFSMSWSCLNKATQELNLKIKGEIVEYCIADLWKRYNR